MQETTQERLRYEAARTRNMWGKNPTSDLMDQAANELDAQTQLEPAKKKPGRPKKQQQETTDES